MLHLCIALEESRKKAIEDSREKIAKAINCKNANEIYFTACGSESDNLANKGYCIC